jgi:hypothetical protein
MFSFESSAYPINCLSISDSSLVLNSVIKSAFLGFNRNDNLSSLIFVSSLGTNLSNSFAYGPPFILPVAFSSNSISSKS